ncbi:hypothetical protein BDZ89DRAFT_1120251 [Hymenopellis radicata]|nr:hypothetical protein BDZ89DRAFT_1120251 [Hymenopellis radicata]
MFIDSHTIPSTYFSMSVLPKSALGAEPARPPSSFLDESLASQDVSNAHSESGQPCSSESQHRDSTLDTPVPSLCHTPRELGVVDKLNILLPHVISLVKILVVAYVAWRALTMIQPMLHFIVNTLAFISGIFGALSRLGNTAMSGYSSAMHIASQYLGMGLGNTSEPFNLTLTNPLTNVTPEASAGSVAAPRADLVYGLVYRAANSTQNFFDVFYELCNARGLETFLQETIQISVSARTVGRDADIPDRQVVVSGVMAVHTSFSDVYKVLLYVRYAGLGFLEGYIGWLLYLQERIDQLPTENDDTYLTEWLSFIASVNEDFHSTADDAIAFQAYVREQIPLVKGAKELAIKVTTDLSTRLIPLQNRGVFTYLPDFLYDICRNNFFVVRLRHESFVLLRGASVQIDLANTHLALFNLLDARLHELITCTLEFQIRLDESKKRAKDVRDPKVIRRQFVRVVDDLVRKKDALMTEVALRLSLVFPQSPVAGDGIVLGFPNLCAWTDGLQQLTRNPAQVFSVSVEG